VSAPIQGKVEGVAVRRPLSSRSATVLGLIAGGITGTVFGLIVAVVPWSDPVDTPALIAGSFLAGAFMFCGVFVIAKRPGDRVGALMIAVAVTFGLPALAAIPTSLTYVLGNTVFIQLWLVVLGHLFLAFPSGRLTSTFDRALVVTTYVWWLLIEVLIVASLDPVASRWPYDNPFFVLRDADTARTISAVEAAGSTVLGLMFFYAIIGHWRRATPARRRILLPVVWAFVPTLIVIATRFLSVFGINTDIVTDSAFGLFALTALPVGFAVGLLRSRMGRSQVADLVVELGEAPAPGRARDTLAAILHDPTLQIAYRLTDPPGYVDEAGRSIAIDTLGHAVTPIERGGEEIAALVHDPAVSDDPDLLRSAVAATRLAVENERLAAEVRAQLEEVRASRERIVEAGDVERRRVERNLHDGAQQRLMTLSLAMRQLRDQMPDDATPRLEGEVDELLAELKRAIDELRELARGIHPAILTEEGVAAAVESLADRSPVPVRIECTPEGRFPDAVEATVYFVVAECLANVIKYASATRAVVTIEDTGRSLLVEVSDDGVGGADVTKGSGLRGLTDRAEAVGGRLVVESSRAGGTVVRAEVPFDGR
jgi:signal transduction histidine kinase